MKIEKRKLSDIRPYPGNPRKNDAAVDAVAESIRQCGYLSPIIVDEEGVILAGHTRYKALKKLRRKQADVAIAEGLSEEQKRKFRLLDNKVGEIAEWDEELLRIELGDLDFGQFDFDFPSFELPETVAVQGYERRKRIDDVVEDDYDEAPPDEPRTRRGDIWILGNHRVMCGDTSLREDLDRLMDGSEADMVFTDPPYGVAIGDKNLFLNKVRKGSGRCVDNIEGDTLSEAELHNLLLKAFVNIREACAEDAVYYVTSPQGGSLGLMMMMRDAGLPVRHVLMWKKNAPTFSLGRLDYDYQHEPIFYTWAKKHHNFRQGECRSTIWEFDKPRASKLHPTMKPVALVANAILDGTEPDMIVLDGFGGSGTTVIAAEQLGRRAYVMEIDPKYVDVIVDRWEEATGNKAVKL